MGRIKQNGEDEVRRAQEWFAREVTYEGEAYTIDAEQARAVIDKSQNTIVVARAGSGKTRTIVAKIVYLIAKCGVQPEEIMTFVFNANAAAEINARLTKMLVCEKPVISEGAEIANTFHAFSRKIVYEVCDGWQKCGKILASEKTEFIQAIVQKMLSEEKWAEKIRGFICGKNIETKIDSDEIWNFAKMMVLFINRAQQKFLAGEHTLKEAMKQRRAAGDLSQREENFITLGAECYRRYHWYLLNEQARRWLGKQGEFGEYGTDFNLLVSWASKLIFKGQNEVRELLANKRYILIDEYQDFSQLFLSVVLAIRRIRPEVKLFVVGDDWQAINRFAGSDVEYFREFERYFADGSCRLEITTNYRCNYAVVDATRRFMKKAMREHGNFRAYSRKAGEVVIVDPRETDLEYALVRYDARVSGRDQIYTDMAWKMLGRRPKKKTVRYIKTLVEVMRKNCKANEVLLLHRNNETNIEGMSLVAMSRGLKWGLVRLGIMTGAEYDTKVRLMTIHKSKGLEAEVVIILEADEGVIPKAHPDTNLYGVFGESEAVALADQARLFYVAMTRAKKCLYIMHNKTKKRKNDGFVRYLGRI